MTTQMLSASHDLTKDFEFVEHLVEQGGPQINEYPKLTRWLQRALAAYEEGIYQDEEIDQIRYTLGEALSAKTMQGMAYVKSHGYAGDFEIIDRTYCHAVCAEPHLARWDHYYHSRPAAQAVRNRKTYFHQVLQQLETTRRGRDLHVLNLASGPGRDMAEYYEVNCHSRIYFHCIERDGDAIAYAQTLCAPYRNQITFSQANVLRMPIPASGFDLIWAGGLFDYFKDRVFVHMLKRLYAALKEGGRLIVGNFATGNPTRGYMTLCEWELYYRSADDLLDLALACGVAADCIAVTCEPLGINLFLNIKR